MGSSVTSLQAFFALLGSNDQKYEDFCKDPVAFVINSDLSNDDKFFLLAIGQSSQKDRVVYSFNFSQDQLEPQINGAGEQVFIIKGNQHNIQKRDRVQMPHRIDGSFNLDTFELCFDVNHGEVDSKGEEGSNVTSLTSVVHTFAFSKNNIRLMNGDFVILGTQSNIDVPSNFSKNEIVSSDIVEKLPHRINGSFDEKSIQLSVNVFLDNPEA